MSPSELLVLTASPPRMAVHLVHSLSGKLWSGVAGAKNDRMQGDIGPS